MTLPLIHSLSGMTAAGAAAVEAAHDSMAYWLAPKAVKVEPLTPAAQKPAAALEQMYAYFD